MQMKKLMIFLFVIILLVVFYYIGPRLPRTPLNTELPDIAVPLDSLETYVRGKDAKLPVKPGNGGEIVWADSSGKTTPYVLLYLHGFSASHYEGYPITHDFIKEFGMNAYLPRLAAHGLDVQEPLLDMTPANLYNSAKEALMIAHKLGQKVIIMSTSTGCTLALMLAADYPRLVDGLILYSPNIEIKNHFAPLLSGPWGLQIARLFHGGKYYRSSDTSDSEDCKYWNCRYRVEAQVYLQQLLDMRMNRKEFARVHQPVFLGYYYKDEEHQDQTIEVKAALRMFDELGTPEDQKMKVAFPEAGVHVIACGLSSKAIPQVREKTFEFARRILGLQKK